MTAVGGGALPGPRSPGAWLELARHGTLEEKFNLATQEGVTEEALLVLVTDPDLGVSTGVLGNYGASGRVIAALVERRPEAREQAAGHPNATVELKDELPTYKHSPLAIERYLDDRDATLEQRREVQAAHLSNDRRSLADVWAAARGL